MKEYIKNTILVILALLILGVVTKMIEGPDRKWVIQEIEEHNGTIIEIDKDGIKYKIGETYTWTTWNKAEKHFKDLND